MYKVEVYTYNAVYIIMIIIIIANCMFIMTMRYITFGHNTHLLHMSLGRNQLTIHDLYVMNSNSL